MAEQHDRILGYFLEEAGEQLHTIEQGLRKLAETVTQPTMIRELYRAAHSIKGSAAMLGLPAIRQIGNQFEENFKLLEERPEIAVDDKLQSLFLQSFSLLQAKIDEVSESSDPYRQDPAALNPIADPVFAELKSHLQYLVANLAPAPAAVWELQLDRDLLPDLDDSNNFDFLEIANTTFNNNELALDELMHSLGESINPNTDPIDSNHSIWFNPQDFANLDVPLQIDQEPTQQASQPENIERSLDDVVDRAESHVNHSENLEQSDRLTLDADDLDSIDIWSNANLETQPSTSSVQALETTIALELSDDDTPRLQTELVPDTIPDVASQFPNSAQGNSDIWGINAPAAEPIGSEELNSFQLDRYFLDNITSIPADTQSFNWDDNAIAEPVDCFANFDLDILGDREPVNELTDFDFERTFADELPSFNFDSEFINKLSANSSIADDCEDFDLEFLNGIQPEAELSLDGTDNLDLGMAIDELTNNTSTIDSFTNSDINSFDNHHLDTDLDFESASDLSNLNLKDFSDLSLEELGADESSAPQSHDIEFAALAFNLYDPDGLSFPATDPNAPIDFDFDLEMFDTNESNLGSGSGLVNDLAELNLTSITDLQLNDLSIDAGLPMLDNNLDLSDRIEVAAYDDFANFNLDRMNDASFNSDELPSSNFNDLSALDFNLDNLSNNELTDLANMLGSPIQLFPQDGNLENPGDLDALLDVTDLEMSDTAFMDLNVLVDLPSSHTPETSLDDLDSLLDTPTLTPAPAPASTPKSDKPPDRKAKQSRTFEQTMRVSVRHLDNLNNLVGELVVNRNTLEQDQNRMRQFVEKLLSEVQKLNEVGKRMQDLYERSLMENSLVASRQQYKPASVPSPQISNNLDENGTLIEYDPLEMDRFTPIHLLSQKMIELTVRVRESTADIEFVVDGSTEVTRTLRQITGQLQEDLTKSRMIPFAQTADRLQRGVRDNGLKYGKQIELNVEGRDTLIDKVILESLTEPLIHMVNNAIAHGIESIETRLAAGKSSNGKITIRALHQGNQTIISISDDGAGIDTERVKSKAIEKGIITVQQAAAMSKPEAYELLFLPSFSTKDQADELAGRGVGMDVVKTSITEIRGTITTESQLGIGTTFTIRLPLALSIAKALIAVNNKSTIAFPMDGIEDTKNISPEQIQINDKGEQCFFWREGLMPFKPLSDLLEFNRPLARNNFYTSNEDDSDLISILVLRSDGILTAIQVDKITGDREIAIKPLQGPASKPLGVAGATVMGDGRIIPIADVMELIALANNTLARRVPTQWLDKITTPAIEVRESIVLIVDDSITVRELLSLTFKRAGYRVEQARDGQEAWDKLRAGLPCDIVFCDIEMPRMDGLEFLSRIQKDIALKKLPIAMLTSRGSDRHRQIASQLGASGYFIKPYLEEALLDAAKRMIKGEVLQIV